MDTVLFAKGNYFNGKISRIDPNSNAVFVDIGADRYGFLPFSSVYGGSITADSATLIVGQQLVVYITQEEEGNKGVSLAIADELPINKIVHNHSVKKSYVVDVCYGLVILFFVMLFIVTVGNGDFS
jgi:Ribonuclease G/E